MKQLSIHILLLLVVASGVFFTNLGASRLWDRDEPRNAGCAVEMMARGDWVVPTFNDELRYQKPVLTYWLMMSAFWFLGTNEFAARFWSAVLGVATVLLTYGIGRRLFNPNVGFLAGLVLSSCMMFDVAARAATPDSVLIFCSTLALFCYIMGTFVKEKAVDEEAGETIIGETILRDEQSWFPKSWLCSLGIYGAMGLAVLAKGPVGIVLPTAIIGMFLLIMRLPEFEKGFWKTQGWLSRFVLSCLRPFHPWHFLKTCWAMRPLTAIIVVLLIAAPWYVMVGLKTDGDFLRIFFLSENFGRATSAFENHSGGLWYYPLALLLGFFPWSVFWLPVAIGLDRELTKTRSNFAVIFLMCWVGVQVGLFSIASTKLPSYITPCYPALALLTGWCLHRWAIGASDVPQGWFKLAQASMIVAGVLITAGLGFVCWKILDGSWWLVAFGAIPLLGGFVGLWWVNREKNMNALVTTALVAVLFCLGFFGFGTRIVGQYQTSQVVLDHVLSQQPGVHVAAYRCMESSWVLYGSKPIFELELSDTEAQSLDRANWWEPKPRVSPEQFVNEVGSALFITTDEHVEELKSRLPSGYQVVTSTDYFLQNSQLVLLAPDSLIAAEPVPAVTEGAQFEEHLLR